MFFYKLNLALVFIKWVTCHGLDFCCTYALTHALVVHTYLPGFRASSLQFTLNPVEIVLKHICVLVLICNSVVRSILSGPLQFKSYLIFFISNLYVSMCSQSLRSVDVDFTLLHLCQFRDFPVLKGQSQLKRKKGDGEGVITNVLYSTAGCGDGIKR